jgi:hypothetical protein
MGDGTTVILARLLCGLSLLLLSAVQQKAFALPAAPPAIAESDQRDSGKKKKCPLTLQQTLPEAYSSRASDAAANCPGQRSDGRFPPFSGESPLPATDDAATVLFAHRPAAQRVLRPTTEDLPCLIAYRVCLRRIGPPGMRASAA